MCVPVKVWIPHCLPFYYDLPLTLQLEASSWVLIFLGSGGCLSPHSSHIPRELIKDVWNAWLIGLKYWRWLGQVCAEAERDRQTASVPKRFFQPLSWYHGFYVYMQVCTRKHHCVCRCDVCQYPSIHVLLCKHIHKHTCTYTHMHVTYVTCFS